MTGELENDCSSRRQKRRRNTVRILEIRWSTRRLILQNLCGVSIGNSSAGTADTENHA